MSKEEIKITDVEIIDNIEASAKCLLQIRSLLNFELRLAIDEIFHNLQLLDYLYKE